ncbi:hypothetical protein RAH32_09735 [Paracoccus sp. WLY502]|uniref:hypothetical protein n=1 Tax=Paracoccus yibinensis TaxID=3068891 RepID=UPI002796A1BF|nr:hypothetical protein [Paracoccus sp. WLY502]MDQ1900720.1 hypothetical protein [Paracoccus sp. WLY502]
MSRIVNNRVKKAPSDDKDDAFRRVLRSFTGGAIDDTLRALEANGLMMRTRCASQVNAMWEKMWGRI